MNSIATNTFAGADGLMVKRGDVRPSDDPVVRAYPRFFRPADAAPVEAVEAASAAPGEVRGTPEADAPRQAVSEPVEAATAAPGKPRPAKPRGKGGKRG